MLPSPSPKVSAPPYLPRAAQTIGLFVALFSAFVVLRSHDLFAVDGAVRAFFVFHDGHPSFGGTNHMLYPVWIFVWTQILGHLGVDISSPIAFIRIAQAMNAFFAAGAATSLFVAIRIFGVRTAAALIATLGWSFSYAVILHATNAAEPMPGMFLAVVALTLVLLGCARSRQWYWFIVPGLLLALAMASYQAMVFVGVGCVLTSFLWAEGGVWDSKRSLQRSCAITVAFILGLLGIYGAAYYVQGVRDVHSGLHAFLTSPDRNVYGHFSLSRVVNLGSGLIGNVLHSLPDRFAGYRSLLRTESLWIAWFAVCAVLLLAVGVLEAKALMKSWRNLSQPAKATIIGCGATLGLWALLLCYWDPNYTKFWLQPVWLLFLIAAIVFDSAAKSKFLAVLSCLLVTVIVLVDVSSALAAARSPWSDLDEASRIRRYVGKNDTVIIAWDRVSILYRTIWAPEQTFDFPTESCVQGGNAESLLNAVEAATREHHGSVYFLGLLDTPKSSWDPFLNDRCGVPYSVLDKYRRSAKAVEKFNSGNRQLVLYSTPEK